MKNRSAIIGAMMGLLLTGWIIHLRSSQRNSVTIPSPPAQVSENRPTSSRTRSTLPTRSSVSDLPDTNIFNRLMRGERPRLTFEQANHYAEENGRSPTSLLAAFHSSGDTNFLNEAKEKYPGDPAVACAAVRNSASPEERRHWIESFKTAAPENALANYLSAYDYIKSGQKNLAVQELQAISTKTSFQDYSLDYILNAEEAYRAAGYSEAESKSAGSSSVKFSLLGQMRQLANSLVTIAESYSAAGDAGSAQAVLETTLNLGRGLEQLGGFTLNHELTGIGIETQVLNRLDPESSYNGGTQTVRARLDELKQRQEELAALSRAAIPLMPAVSATDLASYVERTKVYGEEAALRWVVSKYGQH